MPRLLQTLLLARLFSMLGNKKLGVVAVEQNKQADRLYIQELIESGKVRSIIDRRFSLSEAPEALRYLGEGHALGDVVITM